MPSPQALVNQDHRWVAGGRIGYPNASPLLEFRISNMPAPSLGGVSAPVGLCDICPGRRISLASRVAYLQYATYATSVPEMMIRTPDSDASRTARTRIPALHPDSSGVRPRKIDRQMDRQIEIETETEIEREIQLRLVFFFFVCVWARFATELSIPRLNPIILKSSILRLKSR